MQNGIMWLFIFAIVLHLGSVYSSKADFPLHVFRVQDLEIPATKMECPDIMRFTRSGRKPI